MKRGLFTIAMVAGVSVAHASVDHDNCVAAGRVMRMAATLRDSGASEVDAKASLARASEGAGMKATVLAANLELVHAVFTDSEFRKLSPDAIQIGWLEKCE